MSSKKKLESSVCISILLKLNLAVKRELIKLDLIGRLTINEYLGSMRGIEASLFNLSVLPVSHCAATPWSDAQVAPSMFES